MYGCQPEFARPGQFAPGRPGLLAVDFVFSLRTKPTCHEKHDLLPHFARPAVALQHDPLMAYGTGPTPGKRGPPLGNPRATGHLRPRRRGPAEPCGLQRWRHCRACLCNRADARGGPGGPYRRGRQPHRHPSRFGTWLKAPGDGIAYRHGSAWRQFRRVRRLPFSNRSGPRAS